MVGIAKSQAIDNFTHGFMTEKQSVRPNYENRK